MVDEENVRQIREMRSRGDSISSIARTLGLSRPTVRKFLQDSDSRPQGDRPPHKSFPFHAKEKETEAGDVIPVRNPSLRLREKRETVEEAELDVRRERAIKELEKIRGPQEHPLISEKRAELETKKMSLEEFKIERELEALKQEEKKKAQAEREFHLQRIREAEEAREKEEKAERHEQWIMRWQQWALSEVIASDVSLPVDVKFTIKNETRKLLESMPEDEPDTEELVRSKVETIIKPYLEQMEQARRIAEEKRKQEEDRKRKERRDEFINKALKEVDIYVCEGSLDRWVNEETKNKIRNLIKNHLTETLPQDIIFPPYASVRKILESAFEGVKERVREVEEKAAKERMRQERVEQLIQMGMNRFNLYIVKNYDDLQPLDSKKEERARQYLREELKKKIRGDESKEEVENLTDDILDDFFFQGE